MELCEDEQRAGWLFEVVDLIEGVTDKVHSQSARTRMIDWAWLTTVNLERGPIIPQPETDRPAWGALKGKRYQLVIFKIVGMPDDVCARFIYAQDHEIDLSARERTILEKLADTLPHQPKVCGVAREIKLVLHLSPTARIVISSCGGIFPRCSASN